MGEKRPARILVIGSKPSTRAVTSYGWEELPTDLNVADYDKVVLDLAPIAADRGVAERVTQGNLPTFDQVMRLLSSPGGELVIVGGTPGTPLWGEWHRGGSTTIPLISLFPLLPRFEVDESGESIVGVRAEFGWYFERVARWVWWADPNGFVGGREHEVAAYVREAGAEAEVLRPLVEPLAETRFGKCVAFALRYDALSDGYGEGEYVHTFGPVVWLPLATGLSPKETVELVLARMMGVGGIVRAPEWAERYALPEEEAAAGRLDALRDEASRLGEEIRLAGERLDHERRFKRLLFEQGDELERAVWEALEMLGAIVQRPAAGASEEDGRFEDPSGRTAMLEIKGRGGSARLQDVRQLHDWMENAYYAEGWEGKGVLVVNAQLSEDPASRRDPFPDNCVRAAERYGICLMTSKRLYDEIGAAQKGEADPERFWASVFETEGVWTLDGA